LGRKTLINLKEFKSVKMPPSIAFDLFYAVALAAIMIGMVLPSSVNGFAFSGEAGSRHISSRTRNLEHTLATTCHRRPSMDVLWGEDSELKRQQRVRGGDGRRKIRPFSLPQLWATTDNTNKIETKGDVSDFIYSLIDEEQYRGDDEARRQKVQSVLEEHISTVTDEDGDQVLSPYSVQFVAIFQSSLTHIGDEVQAEARAAKEAEAPLPLPTSTAPSSDQSLASNDDDIPAARSAPSREDQRLWAMVDMLIQSKMLINKMTPS
jgi:hypothetical protein